MMGKARYGWSGRDHSFGLGGPDRRFGGMVVTLVAALVGLSSLAGLSGLVGCQREQQGTLVVRWSIKTLDSTDAHPCATAGVQDILLQIGRKGQTSPYPTYRFSCADGQARLYLDEGIYDVTVLARHGSDPVFVATLTDVQVIGDSVRDWVGPYPPSPKDANDINIPWCGNGSVEQDEACDDGVDNSDQNPGACRTDCRASRCGDGVADPNEDCDGADLNGTGCPDLGYAAGNLGCSADCRFDEAGCLPAESDLTLNWTVMTADATAQSDCQTEGVALVHYTVSDDRYGQVLADGLSDCPALSVRLEAIPLGVVDVMLEGLDANSRSIAGGSAQHELHESLDGTTVSIRLVPYQ
ncbi:MAG: hypothetical protein J7M25_18385 [Deltaproteobacteria bacterium]|nr:hypothetical protein [Deltaproteobacteria bacterium]